MKRIFLVFFLIIFFLFFSLPVKAERINSFDVQIKINKDASINVQEKIIYDFGLKLHHGIFRDIPYIKTNNQGKKYKLEINILSIKDEQGRAYLYKKIDEGDQIKLKIGDPKKTITGVHTYIIEYKVKGALTYFSDHDELYWNVTGNNWPVPISFSTSGVKLPVGIDQNKIKTACYTGFLGDQASNCQIDFDRNQNQVVFSLIEPLSARQGLTVVVGFPKDIVAFVPAKEYIPFWQTALGEKLKIFLIIIVVLAVLFWYIIYPIRIVYKWWKYGRDPDPRSGQDPLAMSGQIPSGEVRAWYDPPKTKKGRSLTSAEIGSLIDEKVDNADIFSLLVDLARRGFFKIEERKKKDFYFIRHEINEEKTSQLLPFEKEILNVLFKSKDEVRLKDKKMYSGIEKVKGLIYEQLVADGFFPKDPSKIRLFYTVVSIFALATANLPLVLAAVIFGRNMPRKTVLGVHAANIGRSLKNFLSSQKRQLEFQAEKQMMFEKLLPYAIAFGVEKIWAKRFAEFDLKPPDWYKSYDSNQRFNSSVFADSLSRSYSTLQSATVSSTGSSSGFSGGFSGGGGGGGGGGSW